MESLYFVLFLRRSDDGKVVRFGSDLRISWLIVRDRKWKIRLFDKEQCSVRPCPTRNGLIY